MAVLSSVSNPPTQTLEKAIRDAITAGTSQIVAEEAEIAAQRCAARVKLLAEKIAARIQTDYSHIGGRMVVDVRFNEKPRE
jgi:hypothetical protein